MKELSEISLTELWDLFPVVLKPHSADYKDAFDDERARIETLAAGRCEIARISHIGSTAVPGLIAKPIVDILMEIRSFADAEALKAALETEWVCMARSDDRMSFNKGYMPKGFADRVFHLHVARAGDPDELYFRDYLIAHPDAAAAYAQLKIGLARTYERDRDGYTAAKTDFVRTVTQAARAEFGGRYALGGTDGSGG